MIDTTKGYMIYNGGYWNLVPGENEAEAISFCKQHGIKIIKALPHEEWFKQL